MTIHNSLYDRNGRYVLLACLLIHELAHVVWCRRMLPLAEDEFARTGKFRSTFPNLNSPVQTSFVRLALPSNSRSSGAIMWATNEKGENFGNIEWIPTEKDEIYQSIGEEGGRWDLSCYCQRQDHMVGTR